MVEMYCPYCGKLAYWYEMKVGKDKPTYHACCDEALRVPVSVQD